MYKKLLVLLLLSILSACGISPQDAVPVFDSARVSLEEYTLFSLALQSMIDNILDPGCEKILVYNHTSLGMIEDDIERLRKGLTNRHVEITNGMIDTLIDHNQTYAALELAFVTSIPVELIDLEQLQTLIQASEAGCQETAQALYPYPKCQGFVTLSRAVYNETGDIAVVYLESYLCGGRGYITLMSHGEEGWTLDKFAPIWSEKEQ